MLVGFLWTTRVSDFLSYRYETSSEVMSDVDCTKKAICEIYQNSQELGQLGERAMHVL